MNEHTFCFFFFFSFLLIITTLPQSHSHPCTELPYNCGNLSNIWYPFWGENRPSICGGGEPFMLNCNSNETTTILIQSQNFTILNINTKDYTIKMKRTDLDIDVCSPQFHDTYLNPNLFRYDSTVRNITIFYDCSSNDFPNSICGDKNAAIYRFGVEDELVEQVPTFKSCRRRIQVPVEPFHDNGVINRRNLDYGLDQGFEVKYIVDEECVKCLGSDEENCSRDWNWNNDPEFCRYIYCEDGFITSAIDSHTCFTTHKKSRTWNLKLKLGVGVVSAVLGALAMFTIIYVYKRRKNSYAISYMQARSLSSDPSSKDLEKGSQPFRSKIFARHVRLPLKTKNDKDIEAFLKNHGALAQKRYKFSEVKKMTNSFKVKLGQGGFGAVYKGKLPNGVIVAVKILSASKGNGEDFINEVSSISRTSHVNVVTLLGFCFEGRKKALIYEFMTNGSLDKFIYNKGPGTIVSLSWDNLDRIAKGIARGLEYLHRGCTTRILHFDIKPHNILLDENFCPKISDFGLAKLCLKKESIISMSDARGTMGYVAPEVWNRHFGGVSYKSDVYSYGMMLLEMVGGRKNINAEASHTSEIYFPHWVYTRLQLGNDMRPNEVMITEEDEIARRMTIVGLWCIQTFPTDRPTMSRVIEMLEGNINSLEIPPKPLLSSPTRSESSNSLPS